MEGGAGGQVKERGCRRRKVTAGRAGGRGEAEQDELRNHGPTAGRTDGACGRPGSSPGYGAPAAAMEQRLRALEQLVRGEAGGSPGLDGLLDLLLGVHQELSSAPLRRERNVAQFLSWAGPFVTKVKELRLQRDDFEILKVIGRGAFGEVSQSWGG